MMLRLLLAASAIATIGGTQADVPPILDPAPYTTWTSTSLDGLSRRAEVKVPFTNSTGSDDFVNMLRVDLVGDAVQRGQAHGELLSAELVELIDTGIPKWMESMVLDLDLSALPEWLAALIKAAGVEHAVPALNTALDWVYEQESSMIPQRLIDEMEGIAQGLCDAQSAETTRTTEGQEQEQEACDVSEWTIKIKRVNMLPELIRMTCTMLGAWDQASASGNLLQLRALDFGSGPFANYTTLAVHRPGDGARSFASVSFPGLVGIITGISEGGIGLSEKVWEVYNTSTGVQPGAYDGEPVVCVIRDIVELADDRASAEAYMRGANRTWSVFLGVGDFSTNEMDIVGYRHDDLHVYTPETMPAITLQPEFENLVYVDKHPQADDLPVLIEDHYGSIDIQPIMNISAQHETGDLHIAVYDFGSPDNAHADAMMWVAIGRIDKTGDYGPDGVAWKAAYRPYLSFKLSDLWTGI